MAAIDRLIRYADLKFLVNLDFSESKNFFGSNETQSVSTLSMLQVVFKIHSVGHLSRFIMFPNSQSGDWVVKVLLLIFSAN